MEKDLLTSLSKQKGNKPTCRYLGLADVQVLLSLPWAYCKLHPAKLFKLIPMYMKHCGALIKRDSVYLADWPSLLPGPDLSVEYESVAVNHGYVCPFSSLCQTEKVDISYLVVTYSTSPVW